jgi:cytochrome P450
MQEGSIELAPEPRLSGFGSLLRYRKRPLQRFEDARAHSPRATAFEIFGTYHLALFDPELIETVLVTDHSSFEKDAFVRDLEQILGRGLLNSEGREWRRQRKLSAPSFQRAEIASYAEQMVASAEEFLARVGDGKPLDIHASMMHLTLEILVKTLFGSQVSRAAEVEAALDGIMAEYSPLRLSLRTGLPPWVTFVSRRNIARLRRALDLVVLELIAQKKAAGGAGTDLLSRLIAASDSEGQLSDAELRDQTMTLFLAGHETTALVLSYALRLLALHPRVAECARREARSVLGARAPTLRDLPELGFVRAVLDETLRLFPPAWAIARVSLRDRAIGEFVCKAQTEVLIAPWVMHRDQRFFREPELFKPERWGASNELPRCAYMPFGAGPRVCIGNHFALSEALLVLSLFLARGNFHLLDGPLLRLTPAVTLRPSGPINMRFERH